VIYGQFLAMPTHLVADWNAATERRQSSSILALLPPEGGSHDGGSHLKAEATMAMKSHTSMPEWQSFEARMRRRRVERCLRGASAAIEANAPDAAKAFLAEARAISPDDPEIDTVNEQLGATVDISWLRQDRRRPSRTTVLVLVSLGLGCVAAWFSTPEGARTLTGLAGTVTTALSYIVEIATRAGIPQAV
jgi:hypothetical protein